MDVTVQRSHVSLLGVLSGRVCDVKMEVILSSTVGRKKSWLLESHRLGRAARNEPTEHQR